MLQLGDEVALYSVVFVLLLLGTRSPVCSTVLTASLYLFLTMFRFPQLPTSRARQVLHPAKGVVGSGNVSVVAHRCGGHDAPENTIVAIREVRRGREVWGLVCVCVGVTLLLSFHQDIMSLLTTGQLSNISIIFNN